MLRLAEGSGCALLNSFLQTENAGKMKPYTAETGKVLLNPRILTAAAMKQQRNDQIWF